MTKKFVILFCSLSSDALLNPTIVGRLNWSGFKRSLKNRNLYYRNVPASKIPNSGINVSYYYYLEGKRKQYTDSYFDSLVQSIDGQAERTLRAKAFNDSNGYTADYFNRTYSPLDNIFA